jgi:N6-L-threonylcarbamoyladenine synthase
MLILGIDTSCDDTSAAVVEDGTGILSNIVSNQNELHKKYGGIVPELASRKHVELITPVVSEALASAEASIHDIDAIAVTHGPGLIGSLLVGVCFAKSLSYVHGIPIVAVNHLEGHICSYYLESTPVFPHLALVVSGGHTSIYNVAGTGNYEEIGRTRDDAAGEAYDKVAKLLGYGYPGGPIIDELAAKGDSHSVKFPRSFLKDCYDFSFSGLKTAVLTYVRKNPDASKEDIAASFQGAVIDVLVGRSIEVAKKRGINLITVSGGVSANKGLRSAMKEKTSAEGLEIFLPSMPLCTDNAAMIASAGYYHFLKGETAAFDLNPKACLPLGSANG